MPAFNETKGYKLLGSLAMTSGVSQSLAGLDLTPYRKLYVEIINVGGTGSTSQTMAMNGQMIATIVAVSAPTPRNGNIDIDLSSGFAYTRAPLVIAGAAGATEGTPPTNVEQRNLLTTITNATNAITFTTTATAFNGGTINIYGVK